MNVVIELVLKFLKLKILFLVQLKKHFAFTRIKNEF